MENKRAEYLQKRIAALIYSPWFSVNLISSSSLEVIYLINFSILHYFKGRQAVLCLEKKHSALRVQLQSSSMCMLAGHVSLQGNLPSSVHKGYRGGGGEGAEPSKAFEVWILQVSRLPFVLRRAVYTAYKRDSPLFHVRFIHFHFYFIFACMCQSDPRDNGHPRHATAPESLKRRDTEHRCSKEASGSGTKTLECIMSHLFSTSIQSAREGCQNITLTGSTDLWWKQIACGFYLSYFIILFFLPHKKKQICVYADLQIRVRREISFSPTIPALKDWANARSRKKLDQDRQKETQ